MTNTVILDELIEELMAQQVHSQEEMHGNGLKLVKHEYLARRDFVETAEVKI